MANALGLGEEVSQEDKEELAKRVRPPSYPLTTPPGPPPGPPPTPSLVSAARCLRSRGGGVAR